MLTIYKREMGSYFRSPVAYCIIGFFMAIVGLMFWVNSILQASAQFSTTLSSIGVYLTFIIPIITMKLLADEKKNGTEVIDISVIVRASATIDPKKDIEVINLELILADLETVAKRHLRRRLKFLKKPLQTV